MDTLIITLDGPAGSGKSTVARQLAARLGMVFLDTGAMYRGLTAHCLDLGIDPAREPQRVAALAASVQMSFDWQRDPPRLLIDGHDMDRRLRDPDTTAHVSNVAAIAKVRHRLVEQQRQIVRCHRRLVSDGRDQGSIVFPDAQIKFYLDADPAVRARRRAAQLTAAGQPADEQQLLDQIVRRDTRDSLRSDGPLICPLDAVRIDTSQMTLDQVVCCLETKVKQQIRLKRASEAGK